MNKRLNDTINSIGVISPVGSNFMLSLIVHVYNIVLLSFRKSYYVYENQKISIF